MTKEEKLIVSAYTGVLMTDFSDLYEFIEEKIGKTRLDARISRQGSYERNKRNR